MIKVTTSWWRWKCNLTVIIRSIRGNRVILPSSTKDSSSCAMRKSYPIWEPNLQSKSKWLHLLSKRSQLISHCKHWLRECKLKAIIVMFPIWIWLCNLSSLNLHSQLHQCQWISCQVLTCLPSLISHKQVNLHRLSETTIIWRIQVSMICLIRVRRRAPQKFQRINQTCIKFPNQLTIQCRHQLCQNNLISKCRQASKLTTQHL